MEATKLPGRGTALNPANRYEPIFIELNDAEDSDLPQAPRTLYYRDRSRSVLAENNSPDIPFRFSLNPYRGCEHGCIYCYARPTHEYLSFSAGLDFERRIMIKPEAPELLRRAMMSPQWQAQPIALSGNTDCYQPIERRLRLTRRCLEVFNEFRNPVSIVTKSTLVGRDVDLLGSLAARGAAEVMLSITTLDDELARRMEPRAAQPRLRLEALRTLSDAGIPAGVMVAPVIPGLNDEEVPRLIEAAAGAGARSAGWQLLRLPDPVDELFSAWLSEQFPERRERVLGRIRACRNGRLTDPCFGSRFRGEGVYAQQLEALFEISVRRCGLDKPLPPLNTGAFHRPHTASEQLRLC